jgi:hypothetical protein
MLAELAVMGLPSEQLGRPIDFTISWQRAFSRAFHLWYACSARYGSELAQCHWRMWNRARRPRLREKLRGNGASLWGDGVLGDATERRGKARDSCEAVRCPLTLAGTVRPLMSTRNRPGPSRPPRRVVFLASARATAPAVRDAICYPLAARWVPAARDQRFWAALRPHR